MKQFYKCTKDCLKRTLCQSSVPVWLTLILFGLTAYGTYTLTPRLNQKFEKQKIKSEFVINNLNTFNLATRTLLSKISIYNNSILDHKNIDLKNINEIRSGITELQWRIIEFEIIFDSSAELIIIRKYKDSLRLLGKAVESKDPQTIKDASLVYAKYSREIIRLLADQADLTIQTDL